MSERDEDKLVAKIAKYISRELAREQVNREWGGTPEEVLQAFRDAFNDGNRRGPVKVVPR